MFRLKKNVVSIFFLCLAFPLSIWADDLVQPDWRGRDGTTYQQWTFDNSDNPAAPKTINNSFGTATAAITLGHFASGWLNQLPGLGSKTGYWDIGGSGGQIVLEIDNQPQTQPYKEIWIQVTYFKDITEAPVVRVTGATYVKGRTLVVEHVPTGGDWLLDQSVWRIQPSPSHETIVVQSDCAWGSVIDQIVVDTYASSAVGCIVGVDDLSNFCNQWLATGTYLEADFDKDRDVDFDDFAVLAGLWLSDCPSDWPWQ